jgi:hypothetical protein
VHCFLEKAMVKEPVVTYIRLIQNIGLGLMVGVVYWDQQVDQVNRKTMLLVP